MPLSLERPPPGPRARARRLHALAWTLSGCLLPLVVAAQTSAPPLAPTPGAPIVIGNPPGTPPSEEVTLNLKNADIQALISAVSDLTGRNFVVDPRVQATVTVISARPTSREVLYDVFLSVLKVHGFAAVESGKVVKIVPEATAKQEGGGAVSDHVPPGGPRDDLVTLVVGLKNTDAPSVIGAVQPFASPTGHLTAHVGGNTLVISDTRANADRLLGIIERIDQAISTEIEVIRLRFAAAGDVATTLNSLAGGGGGGAQPGVPAPTPGGGQVVADERTNSLLLGGPAEQRLRLRALISHLDTPIERTGPEVVYLRYAKAADLAPLLTSIATGGAMGGAGAAAGAPPPLPIPGAGPGGGAGGTGAEIRIQA
ncbi:MAG TPA: hypothetical protein DCY89_02800, partial [Gammaproteobacteria bacterium]|nr:hypothetical protein [Gammaproteobacteria bacterium]